jgi:hypothetical protein
MGISFEQSATCEYLRIVTAAASHARARRHACAVRAATPACARGGGGGGGSDAAGRGGPRLASSPPPPQPLLTQIIVNPCGDAAYNARVALSHAELGDETHLYSVELTCDDALRPLLDASNAGSAADVAAVTSAPPNAPPNTEAPS